MLNVEPKVGQVYSNGDCRFTVVGLPLPRTDGAVELEQRPERFPDAKSQRLSVEWKRFRQSVRLVEDPDGKPVDKPKKETRLVPGDIVRLKSGGPAMTVEESA